MMMFRFNGKSYKWTCPVWVLIAGIIIASAVMFCEHPFGL